MSDEFWALLMRHFLYWPAIWSHWWIWIRIQIPSFPKWICFFSLHPLARAISHPLPATCNQKHVAPTMGGVGVHFWYHLCRFAGGFKSMESYHLFFVDVFVKPSCSLPDPEPLNAIEISISFPPPPGEVPMHNLSSQAYGSHLVSDVNQAQEKLLDGRPSSVGEFSHIGQFQVGVWGEWASW